MVTEKIKCLNCGKETKNRKFCCQECNHEYTKKRKEFCPDCGAKLTIETAYSRGNNGLWLDNYCKPCRIKRNNEAYKKRREKIGREYQDTEKGKRIAEGLNKKHTANERICADDGNDHSASKSKWVKRMLNNPVIFADTFHVPATEANVVAQADRLGIWAN